MWREGREAQCKVFCRTEKPIYIGRQDSGSSRGRQSTAAVHYKVLKVPRESLAHRRYGLTALTWKLL